MVIQLRGRVGGEAKSISSYAQHDVVNTMSSLELTAVTMIFAFNADLCSASLTPTSDIPGSYTSIWESR